MPSPDQPLPRALAPNVFWLGDCQQMQFRGAILHSYNSAYVVKGTESSVLVEAGWPVDFDVLCRQLDEVLADGPPLRWIWVTHQETPHAGCIARLLERYPDVVARGDVRDYHLFFPELADRFQPIAEGERLELGGTALAVVEPVIIDLPSTQWAFDTRSRALFPGDGFAYAHHHAVGQCGRVVGEVDEAALDLVSMSAVFAFYALHWMKFTDMRPYGDRLAAFAAELEVATICPTHGLPITDVDATLPVICRSLLQVNTALDPD